MVLKKKKKVKEMESYLSHLAEVTNSCKARCRFKVVF